MWIATVLGQEEYKARTAEWANGAEHRHLLQSAAGTGDEADRGWSAALTARVSWLQTTIRRAVDAATSSTGGPPQPQCC